MTCHKLAQQMMAMTLVFLLLVGCSAPAAKPSPPKPGATLTGTITMDRAKSAQITFKVSDDGQTIEWVSAAFTELKCEGFSAGSTSTKVTGRAAITDGKFEFKSPSIGEISGQFTSPTAAEGTAHLVFVNGKAECGTWKWGATGN